MKLVKLSEVKSNPNNPRVIKDEKFKKLVQSLRDFPDMAKVRPIVCNADMIVLGGNMRLKAMKEAGWKEIPVEVVDWPEEKQREFIIKDNVGYGEWDWQMIQTEWDVEQVQEWGLDVPEFEKEEINENPYTKKVEAPIYEPSDEKPKFADTYDKQKFNELIEKIESSSLDKEHKEFLKLCATRHIVFNYQKIADLYAHSEKEMQELMEDSALVIIDFEKAIELGYVKISDEIEKQFLNEYSDEL